MATGHGICTDHPDADLVDYRGDPICSECGQVVVIREAFVMIQCPDHPQAHLIYNESGDQICSECSLVVAEKSIHIGSEWNPFCKDEEESEDEDKSGDNEGEEDSGYPSTVDVADKTLLQNGTNLITTTMIGLSPRVGNVASFEDRRPVAVYKNKQKVSRSEKTLIEALENIHTMADRMNLGRTLVYRAYQRFEEVQIGNHLKGHSTYLIAATTLHIACREQGVPQSFDDVCSVSNIHIKELENCFKRITEALDITVPPITTTDFMPRFCGNLNLGFPIEKIATHIGIKAVELDIVPGRSPISVAAAAIFMAAHASDKQFARNELSNATGVANVTIRTVYKLMRPRAAELFPDSFNLDLTKLPRV